MTIATESGYTWTDGKHARLLHAGNRFAIKTITASAEADAWPASLLGNELTRDRWKPFENQVSDPAEFDASSWTATNVTIASDSKTLTETTDTGEHDLSQAYTFTAVEHVVAFKVTRQTVPELQVRANDGTTSFTCFFDLRDGTVGTAANCTGQIVDLGDGQYLVAIYFTPVAATGVIELLLADGASAVNYAGSTDNTITVERSYAHESAATLRLDTFTAQGGTCFAVAAHNLASGAARITFEHDSDENDTWTSLGTVTPSDDSPIMFFFDAVTSPRWRITVDRGVLPEIAVLWVGDPLTFQQPIYAGHTPSPINRSTEVIGNMSRTGELLGRSVKRTTLQEAFQWTELKYDWVRANLDGKNGVIQSLEAKPAFIAWRPSETDDVSYIMKSNVTPPQSQGTRDFWSFGIEAEVYSYE